MVDVQQTSTENKIIDLNSHILHIEILAHYIIINNIETTTPSICCILR